MTVSLCHAARLPEGFEEKKIAEGLDPTAMAMAPDGRIFIAEKNGRVLVVRDETLLEDPFIVLEVDNYNERGLSGIAFHPDFENNGFVYFYYTVPQENENRVIRVKANGDLAIPGSEEIILVLDKLSGTIHNGGAMHFGPDGKLYIAVGDGTQGNNSQDLNNLLGKILRINADGSIPADNPFYEDLEEDYRAIWALGFRNPFTMAIQQSTGRIYANDVGRDMWEEVNEVIAGGNYGWNLFTGITQDPNVPSNYYNPVYSYSHDVGCSVIGAAFYEPEMPSFPDEYFGNYFFADYCEGFIKRFNPETKEIIGVFATDINRPVQLLVSPLGDMYYLERNGIGGGSMVDNTSTDNGVLWKIRYTGSGAPSISFHPQSILLSVGETARFMVQSNGSGPFVYQWLRDGIPMSGETSSELYLEDVKLSDDHTGFRCIVSNSFGKDTSQVAYLDVTSNTRPVPDINYPVAGATYKAGDTIFFSGYVNDLEDGPIPAAKYNWKIDFHHNEHTHPALMVTAGIDTGMYVIPRIGEIDDNVWYRVHLTATDNGGLSRSTFRDIFPEKTEFTVNSEPQGLLINVDGRLETTPVTVPSVVGILRTLQVIGFQNLGDENYVFRNWNTGEIEKTIGFFAEAGLIIYTALFDKLPRGNGIGLLGEYFEAEDPLFDTSPRMVRIDPVIQFDWGGSSPDPDRIRDDDFHVRWTGEIESLSEGEYTFYTNTDDGVRLYIGEQLIIDEWIPQPPTEHSGHIRLEEGERYPIRIEYFEAGGGAVAELRWMNPEIRKQIVSQSQLYPGPITNEFGSFSAALKSNPVREILDVVFSSLNGGQANFQIWSVSGQLIVENQASFYPGEWNHSIDVSTLIPGMYMLVIKNETSDKVIDFIKH